MREGERKKVKEREGRPKKREGKRERREKERKKKRRKRRKYDKSKAAVVSQSVSQSAWSKASLARSRDSVKKVFISCLGKFHFHSSFSFFSRLKTEFSPYEGRKSAGQGHIHSSFVQTIEGKKKGERKQRVNVKSKKERGE